MKKKKKSTGSTIINIIIGVIAVSFLIAYWYVALAIVLLYALCVAIVQIYGHCYFKGYLFKVTKNKIIGYVQDCNALNNHILELRDVYGSFRQTDYGDAHANNYNYSMHSSREIRYTPNVYKCSQAVCDGAKKQPFKYLCKYYNIPETEESLVLFETMLNNFIAIEDGKILSQKKHDEIMVYVNNVTPWIIKNWFSDRLNHELGFEEFQFDDLNYPVYSFSYRSAGGRTGSHCDIELNIDNLERFITYLSERVKFKQSALGQRRLMTPKLRKYIIDRDNHTCKLCGNSTYAEPNLLLEVDHIIPVSKGGLTTEDNLQTLCWKCNRHKSDKI